MASSCSVERALSNYMRFVAVRADAVLFATIVRTAQTLPALENEGVQRGAEILSR